ncbi:YozQ family protein [Aquibacillus kalidii]|uniref:YozQ family protein n=1 Tax=Aquibacillus kalidii TaxID=2762597 RepID=UPI002E2BE63A|nr:YozQ family protein [Aquibacillus kalidii]
MDKKRKEMMENADKVAEKMYDPSDYQSNSERDKGFAITHEQATDNYTEGTIDGKIDDVDSNGQLKSSKGREIDREGFNK